MNVVDAEIRAALDRHWAASNAGDDAGEGEIYRDDVELEYPQSGELFRGRRNVLESRGHNPAGRRFEIRRTLGSGDLWVIEYVIFYDRAPGPNRQHHGVPRRKGRARDAVLCRPVRGADVARTLARSDAHGRHRGTPFRERAS